MKNNENIIVNNDHGFYFLCKRLLDIDPTCIGGDKGCPVHFCARPMINEWEKSNENFKKNNKITNTLNRFAWANGQGRVCEITEIQFHAKEYVKLFDLNK